MLPAYNAQGDQVSAMSPAGRKTTAAFNAQSWLVSTVSARGNAAGADPAAYRTTYTGAATVLQAATPRTPGGLVASTTETGAAGAPAQRFSYDGAQRLSAAGPDATRAYAYDAADNPTGLPGGKVQRLDAVNQLTKITAQGGLVETALSYDSDGNRTKGTETVAMEPEIRPPDVVKTYGYDQADQLTSYQGPNNERPGQNVSARYSYDTSLAGRGRDVVTHHPADPDHPKPHWEAGQDKGDYNQYGQRRYGNPKATSDHD
jgi:hypothetical protein